MSGLLFLLWLEESQLVDGCCLLLFRGVIAGLQGLLLGQRQPPLRELVLGNKIISEINGWSGVELGVWL